MIGLSRLVRACWRRAAMATAILLAPATPPGVEAAAPEATAATRSAARERAPEYPHPTRVPPELLRPPTPQAMILPSTPAEEPEGIATEPRSGGVLAEVTPTRRLLPEGYVLARRPARFGREDSWWAIAIGEAGDLPVGPPLRVLPNRRLTLLERILAAGKPEDTYLVTGRVTEFLGKNYVLLEQVVSPPEHRPAPSAEAAQRAAAEAPSATTRPARPPTANEIIEQLMQEMPVRTPVPATARAASVEAAEAAASTREGGGNVQPEGTIVPEFPARLVRSEPWWTLVRESQGSRPVGTPYYVLPNRLLEVMISASAGGTRSVVFLVSGELTEYRGTNYLLVHKVLIRRDMGNLR